MAFATKYGELGVGILFVHNFYSGEKIICAKTDGGHLYTYVKYWIKLPPVPQDKEEGE